MKIFLKKLSQMVILFCFSGILFSCEKKNLDTEKPYITFQNDIQDFYVISANPEGSLPSNVKNPSIQIMFSEPVVPLQKLGEIQEKSDVVEIRPNLKGSFKWLGTSLLSFECEDDIIPQREYTIIVNPETVSINGNKITGPLAFSFYTEDLKLTSIVPGFDAIEKGIIFPENEIPLEYAQNIALYFSVPVDAEYVSKFLKIQDTKTKENYKYKITHKEKSSFNIHIAEKLKENQEIAVILEKNASSDKNARKNSEEQHLSFSTLKNLSVMWTDLEAGSYSNYSNPVKIIFNHQLKENSEEFISSLISTEPEMPVTKENIKISGAMLMVFNLPVTYESTYRLKIKEGLTDIYGKQTEQTISFDIKVPPARSYVNFKDWGFHILEAEYEPKLVFEHQNILSGSQYSVSAVRGKTGEKITKKPFTKTFTSENIQKDTRIIEEVPLKNQLEKAGNSFHGTVAFQSDIKYKNKYTDWKTKEVIEKEYSSKNEQTVQVTDLAITARFGYNKAIVLVTHLSNGKPAINAEISTYFVNDYNDEKVFNESKQGESTFTDENGFAVIDLKEFDLFFKNRMNFFIQAKTSDDCVIFCPRENYVYDEQWNRGYIHNANKEKQVTFIFSDRGLYKPGEKVTFRGIDKTLFHEEYKDYYGSYKIELTDSSWQPTVYAENSDFTSKSGTFWGTFTIPEDLKPGNYNLRYTRTTSQNKEEKPSYVNCPIQVQFFEKLRFEVSSQIPELTYFSGDKITATVKGNYLGGGSLSGSKLNGSWVSEPEGFSAKKEEFKKLTFGPVIGYEGRNWIKDINSSLSANGTASSQLQTGNERIKGMTYRYKLNANISDSANQMISTSSSVLVHPANFYIGLSDIKNIDGFPKAGETLKFDYFLLTPEEQIASTQDTGTNPKIKIELLREEWKQVQQLGWNGEINTRYQREFIADYSSTENLSFNKNGTEISIKPSKSGSYILRLSTKDKKGREIITEKRFFATGSDWIWFNRDSYAEIEITPDKTLYNPGENAKLLVKSPLPKGTYLMTVEREGILSEKIINLESSTSVIELPIEEKYLPNVYVTLSSYSVRNGKPSHDFSTPDLDKPKGFFGHAIVHVDLKPKKFDIRIETEKTNYRPKEEAVIKIFASKDSVPLENAEITLMAVDRGVIDLINYHVQDPLEFFYNSSQFLDYCHGGDSRSLLIDPVTYEVRNLFGGDAKEAVAAKDEELQERKNFEPTAFFEPEIITDENGMAEVRFILPDNLTSYRITAVGVENDNFAIAETELPVTNPVSVRDTLPLKLRPGDICETGVVLTNMTDENQKISVEINILSGANENDEKDSQNIKLPGKASVLDSNIKEITVPKNSSVPLMFNIKAENQGFVQVQFTVRSQILNEKITKNLEIEKHYIFEQVCTTGKLSSAKENDLQTEKIVIPQNIEDENGFVSFTLDSTKLAPLSSAVDYVFTYPYGCLEQRSAKLLPLIAFKDYISVFNLKSEINDIDKFILDELSEWKKSQLPDGSFPYWPSSTESSFFVSARIAEILSVAMEKGINVSEIIDIPSLKEYLSKEISKTLNSGHSIKSYAYAIYALTRLGKTVSESEIDFIVKNENSDFPELCYAGLSYHYNRNDEKAKNIAKTLFKYIRQTPRGIDITQIHENYFWWCFSDKNTENLALALQFFSETDSENYITEKLLHSLLTHESAKKGYYKSTSSTARIFLSVSSFIENKNLEETDLTSSLSLNEKNLGAYDFKGLDSSPVEIKAEFTSDIIKNLPKEQEIPVQFTKEGKGSLYYTMLMKYAILPEEQTSRDEGFSIYTEIYDTETGKKVSKDTLEIGKTYKETVCISTTKDREFAAVRIPVPCGAEILNAAFSTTGEVIEKSEKTKKSADLKDANKTSLSNQTIYANEVQYFWNFFAKGAKTVEFYFRTSRKGTYQTPSSSATCMYEEEIFGRTDGKIWTIK